MFLLVIALVFSTYEQVVTCSMTMSRLYNPVGGVNGHFKGCTVDQMKEALMRSTTILKEKLQIDPRICQGNL